MKYTLMRFPGWKNKAVTLSYDDGTNHDKRLVEILNRYGLKCTFNLNAGHLGKPWYMSEEDALALLKDSSHEVAAHGYNHLSLAEVDSAAAVNDVIEDRKALEKLFGRVIKGMAYANGSYDDKTVEILKQCGISYARTTVSSGNFNKSDDWLRMSATCHHKNPQLMELAKKFVEGEEPSYFWSKNPKLFYLWGHSFEFANDGNWEVIEEFAKYIGGREEIWYATNGEIYDYAKAFERLEFSVDGKYVYNPSAMDVFFMTLDGKKVCVKAGERKEIE